MFSNKIDSQKIKMQESGKNMYCRKCHDFELDNRLPEYLDNYFNNTDSKIKCNESVYKKRLEICENCSSLVNGMCRYCGCFVLVRATKKNLGCPKPGGDCWKITEKHDLLEDRIL